MNEESLPPQLQAAIEAMRRRRKNTTFTLEQVYESVRRAKLSMDNPGLSWRELDRLYKQTDPQRFYIPIVEAVGRNPRDMDAIEEIRRRCRAQVKRAKAGDAELARVYLAMMIDDCRKTFGPESLLYKGLFELMADAAWKVQSPESDGSHLQKPAAKAGKTETTASTSPAAVRELGEKELFLIVPKLIELDHGKKRFPSHFDVFKLYALERLSSTSPEVRARKWKPATITLRKRRIEEVILFPAGIRTPLEKMKANPSVFSNVQKQEAEARRRNARLLRDQDD